LTAATGTSLAYQIAGFASAPTIASCQSFESRFSSWNIAGALAEVLSSLAQG
jgi:hypothetical protein